ncbi:Exodeoxyribonuclease VII large subunit [Clostridium sp. USBA 49]|jgi:exodeoxyribonuclease VII large subunit|uniref:exodeoxyribonuclease VII large subunit n=1 Tax=Clostridium TaxID=1485 RepID=UPI000999B19A|nr:MULTISPECIES: exodeoxyribonuclease VII large subunit [Clostridium]SKA76778.1 Exodeoxyribonuclease VII large subunit [Clostridium sp. USBA 49]
MYIKTLSVSEVNNYIKKIIDFDFILNNINIKGEISNFKAHSSGHFYFSLKDQNSKINCIMFKNYANSLKFIPQNGESVIVKGKISVYEKEGTYQIYCHEIIKQGIGELFIEFDKLKNKLEKEGLFDELHKKPIPKYPRKVGIITSPTGAAIKDIINVSKRRNKYIELLLYPALVQGENASEDLINGIKVLNSRDDIDVIILARGGGSIEELWAFNNEELARAVYNSKKPIITGVGHETDFTLVDFTSDKRAPTPSAAAEIAIPSLADLELNIEHLKTQLDINIKRIIEKNYNKINVLSRTLEMYNPLNYIINQYDYISQLQDKLELIVKSSIAVKKQEINKIYALICAHNPIKILSKGYAIIEDMDNRIISEKEILKNTDIIKITLNDGTIKAKITYMDEYN